MQRPAPWQRPARLWRQMFEGDRPVAEELVVLPSVSAALLAVRKVLDPDVGRRRRGNRGISSRVRNGPQCDTRSCRVASRCSRG